MRQKGERGKGKGEGRRWKGDGREVGTVAVVGASARAAVFSVLRSGWAAVAADLFADADLRLACPVTQISSYPEGLVDWLANAECDGWLYTGALENFPELVDELAAARPLLGNRGDALRNVRNPLQLQEALRERGLHFPETRKSCNGLPLEGTWLLKSYRHSSGCGVAELHAQNTAQFDFVQRVVSGISCSAVFVGTSKCSLLLDVTRQLVGEPWTRAGRFQYCGSIAPWPLAKDIIVQQLRDVGDALSSLFGLVGLFGVDFVLDENGIVWTIEVNPRYTAAVEVVERALGISAIDAHVAACCGREVSPIPTGGQSSCGKVILFAKQEVTVNEKFFRWVIDQLDENMRGSIADIPSVGTQILQGHPVLTLFASCEKSNCQDALQHRVVEVERQLYV